jgi:hypothetical protein
MTESNVLYRVYRRRWPMLPALAFGVLQIAAGVDSLFTHIVLPAGRSPATSVAAGLFIVLGAILILVVLVNLFATPPIIEARADGLFLGVTAPGEPPLKIPWDALKSIEAGHAGPDKHRKEDPLCLIVRFAGARVNQPPKLSIFHSTRGSIYIRSSHLPSLDPIVARLNGLLQERHAASPPEP